MVFNPDSLVLMVEYNFSKWLVEIIENEIKIE